MSPGCGVTEEVSDRLIIERLTVLTDRVEAIQRGQEDLRRAIESGTDGLQVRVRLLEDRMAQDKQERERMIAQQASLRVQLVATIVGVILTAMVTVGISLL